MAITIRSLDDVDIPLQEGPESMKHRDLASKTRAAAKAEALETTVTRLLRIRRIDPLLTEGG
jgi:hypothetical protein